MIYSKTTTIMLSIEEMTEIMAIIMDKMVIMTKIQDHLFPIIEIHCRMAMVEMRDISGAVVKFQIDERFSG